MYTLTYESNATGNPTVKDMEQLLVEARTNNIKNGITGCLIFYNGGFIQIIEGEKAKLEKLYGKIKNDTRHTDVHLFSEANITERTFSNWGMSYIVFDEHSSKTLEVKRLKANILLLSDLSEQTNTTVLLFWRRIKLLLSDPLHQVNN